MIIDTSALLAYFNRREADHAAVTAVIEASLEPLVVSPYVVAELDYLLATRLGVDAEVAALAELAGGAWELPAFGAEDLALARDLVERYADLAIGVADASIVILAARYGTGTIATLDRRHFGVLRPLDGGVSPSRREGVGGSLARACDPVRMGEVGRLEVVCGPMFAGKTEELLRRVRRALIAGRRVTVFTHALDMRHGADRLASHIGRDFPSLAATTPADVEAAVPADAEVVAIDEAQFFGPGLVPVVSRLADSGLVVIVAGLDVTFGGDPFEPLPSLMALAERVDKLTAICTVCGEEAAFHVKVAAGAGAGAGAAAGAGDLVAENVGGVETYQARCRRHGPAASALPQRS